jgi:hypothetical protein
LFLGAKLEFVGVPYLDEFAPPEAAFEVSQS